jgi:hypothetical protein
MFLFGSQALNQYMYTGREPADLDLIGTYEEVEAYRKHIKPKVFYPTRQGRKMFMKTAEGRITEADIAWPGSVEEKLLDFLKAQPDNLPLIRDMVAPSVDVLYMLKMSHRYLKDSPHFLKTMRDIQLMRREGAVLRPEHLDFYKQRMADTYVYAHPKLNVSKDGFFDAVATGVVYTYDHDSIHEAVKINTMPAYSYFKPEDSEVLCSQEMFWDADDHTRLCAVLEEAYVLALERSLVPFPGKKTPKEAFDMALMKVCTSITSGWFREYAWESYDDVQAMYSDSYVEAFQLGLSNGTVKPFNGATMQ